MDVVSEPDIAHQIEFRCNAQSQEDFAPIALSTTDQRFRLVWKSRLGDAGAMLKPPVEGSSPSRAIVYLPFLDGESQMAAIVWRIWDEHAIPLTQEPMRNNLVGRALVGLARSITPELALYLGLAPMPDVIRPAPGQVPVGSRLEPIGADELADLNATALQTLQKIPRGHQGLHLLIAAALRHPTHNLSVILPEREICLPLRQSPQVPLLWGLLRTVRHLQPERPGWSFSTYEEPHGSKDRTEFQRISFRLKDRDVGYQPYHDLNEAVVRPYDRSAQPDDADLFAEVGVCLTQAYSELGSTLEKILKRISDRHRHYVQRLEAVLKEPYLAEFARRSEPLETSGAHGHVPPGTDRQQQVPDPDQAPKQSAHVSAQRLAKQPGPAAGPQSSEGSARFSSGQQVAETSPGHEVRSTPASQPSVDMTVLHRRLSEAAGTAEFQIALAWLSCEVVRGAFLPPHATLPILELIQSKGWYAEQLRSMYDHREVVDALELIFTSILGPIAMHPDQERPLDMLAAWAGAADTPPEALEALAQFAAKADPYVGGLLEQHLLPQVLKRRLTFAPEPEPADQVEPEPADTATPERVDWWESALRWTPTPAQAGRLLLMLVVLQLLTIALRWV